MMTNSMFAIGIISIGLLGAIVALGITERRRFLAGVGIAGFILLVGLASLVVSSLGGWRARNRSARMREENMRRLDELRSQFRTLPVASTATARGSSPEPRRR
jgi:hypothetical protein